jgi:hypothetical protein
MSKILITLILCLSLNGCGMFSGEKSLSIFSMEKSREHLNLKTPTIEEMEKVRWIVITSKNAEEVFARLKKEGLDPVLFGLTDKDYEYLAKNFAQIRTTLRETQDILERYKDYYERTGKKDTQPTATGK